MHSELPQGAAALVIILSLLGVHERRRTGENASPGRGSGPSVGPGHSS